MQEGQPLREGTRIEQIPLSDTAAAGMTDAVAQRSVLPNSERSVQFLLVCFYLKGLDESLTKSVFVSDLDPGPRDV